MKGFITNNNFFSYNRIYEKSHIESLFQTLVIELIYLGEVMQRETDEPNDNNIFYFLFISRVFPNELLIYPSLKKLLICPFKKIRDIISLL